MRRKRIRPLAVGAGSALLAIVAVLAGLAPASAQVEVEVFDPEGPFERVIDLGRPGFGIGDQVLEIHTLLDPADGDPVGRSFTRVTVLRVFHGGEDALIAVDSTYRLDEGDIVFSGVFRLSSLAGGIRGAIHGGTGAYRDATGEAVATAAEVAGREGVVVAFDLTLP
ncbi:MAG TPA: hypothetical protein VNO17_09645 [Actinomycetota bacterium]|nr:hypothetical protein [Actinomycetota bacterium]